MFAQTPNKIAAKRASIIACLLYMFRLGKRASEGMRVARGGWRARLGKVELWYCGSSNQCHCSKTIGGSSPAAVRPCRRGACLWRLRGRARLVYARIGSWVCVRVRWGTFSACERASRFISCFFVWFLCAQWFFDVRGYVDMAFPLLVSPSSLHRFPGGL